jgi:hypothetical protein
VSRSPSILIDRSAVYEGDPWQDRNSGRPGAQTLILRRRVRPPRNCFRVNSEALASRTSID